MTDAAKAVVWKAVYEPFGTVYSTTGAAAQNLRFPGQWFQIESNLAWNWHRHYDATLGRYISADPLNHALNGAPVTATAMRGGATAPFSAKLAWLNQPVLPDMMTITAPVALNRPEATQWLPDQAGSSGLLAVNAAQSIRGTGLFPDGPNLYAYARQAPGKNTDPTGLSMASGPMSVKPPRSMVEQCLGGMGLKDSSDPYCQAMRKQCQRYCTDQYVAEMFRGPEKMRICLRICMNEHGCEM
ncbi:MAG: RHS repeat domain-containing protein [Beijerinckiaceae bacterium]